VLPDIIQLKQEIARNLQVALKQRINSYMGPSNASPRFYVKEGRRVDTIRAYGLTRDELRYILDPADVMGADYPSETFRVLKNNDMRQFGEFRTQRLVLEAWDNLHTGEIS